MEDAVCQNMQFRPRDGAVDVPGAGHDHQAPGPGHGAGDGLAHAQLGAEVTVVVADTGGHGGHLTSDLLSYVEVIRHGVVQVGGHWVLGGGQRLDHLDDQEDDQDDYHNCYGG